MRLAIFLSLVSGLALSACGEGPSGETETAAAEPAQEAATLPNGRTVAEQIKYRQGQFKQLGGKFKAISDSLKSGAPDIEAIQTATTDIKTLTSDMAEWFPTGTGPESGEKTAAKAEIWAQPEDFASKVTAFQTAAAGLAMAAATGDVAAVGPAFGATGGTCKACHDVYKTKG